MAAAVIRLEGALAALLVAAGVDSSASVDGRLSSPGWRAEAPLPDEAGGAAAAEVEALALDSDVNAATGGKFEAGDGIACCQ